LSPYAQISRFSAVTPDFWNAQVGDFEVATSGGFWVAIRDWCSFVLLSDTVVDGHGI